MKKSKCKECIHSINCGFERKIVLRGKNKNTYNIIEFFSCAIEKCDYEKDNK